MRIEFGLNKTLKSGNLMRPLNFNENRNTLFLLQLPKDNGVAPETYFEKKN